MGGDWKRGSCHGNGTFTAAGVFPVEYGDKAKLLFTYTDSLTYENEREDVYEDFRIDKDKFDNSDYRENSPFYDKTNEKVIGKFKDEAAGLVIKEFIGLRSQIIGGFHMTALKFKLENY